MLIRCETSNNYNRFYISNINTMQELKEYADKNIPLECYMLDGRYKHSIYLDKEMTLVHLYLNNYLQYYEIYGYIFNQEELNNVHKTICCNCLYNDYNYDLNCEYIKNDIWCKNYMEKHIPTIKRLIKKYFNK